MNYRLVFRPKIPSGLQRLVGPLLWIVVGGGLVLFVFVLSFYMAMKAERRSTEVVVPQLEGLAFEEATARVEPLALVLEVVDRRHDPALASGRVLQQQPLAGSRVRRGRRLKLVLSLGGKILTVPDIVGQASRAVDFELRRDGFGAGNSSRVHSAEVPSGRIIAQVPPPGSLGVPNTRVHHLVSRGPREREFVMPDLTGLSRRAAERWISTTGFRNGPVRAIITRGWPAGTVVGQDPLAGYPIRRNGIVELTVSR